jgi:hypothetical protein
MRASPAGLLIEALLMTLYAIPAQMMRPIIFAD